VEVIEGRRQDRCSTVRRSIDPRKDRAKFLKLRHKKERKKQSPICLLLGLQVIGYWCHQGPVSPAFMEEYRHRGTLSGLMPWLPHCET
jgi:hypothetical protein